MQISEDQEGNEVILQYKLGLPWIAVKFYSVIPM